MSIWLNYRWKLCVKLVTACTTQAPYKEVSNLAEDIFEHPVSAIPVEKLVAA
jgi:hypothetical protein